MADEQADHEQDFWNVIAILVYVVVAVLCLWLVIRYGGLDPAALSFLDLTIMALAAFRLVHLLTYDKIFGMVRAAFMDREGTRLKTAERGWRRLVCEFMHCIWCTGMWSGLIAVTIYCVGPWGRLTALVLAIAGAGSLLQLVSKALAGERT